MEVVTLLGRQPVDPNDPKAKLQFKWNPLVTWVWWSGWLLLAGTILCAWPEGRRVASGAAAARKAA